MSGKGTVIGNYSPVVVQPGYLPGTRIDHGLDGQGHTRHQLNPSAVLTEVRNLRILMKVRSDSVSYQIPDNAVAELVNVIIDCCRNLMKMISGFRHFDALEKALPGHVNQLLGLGTYLAYRMGPGRVGMIALVNQACVQADDIALLKNMLLMGNSMYDLVVYGYTDGRRISVIIQEVRNTSSLPDELLTQTVNVHGGNARLYKSRKLIVNLFQQLACCAHQFDFSGRFNCNRHHYAPKILTMALNTSSIL